MGRFLEVSAGMQPDIVIELLILAEVDDVVAVEHMFNRIAPRAPVIGTFLLLLASLHHVIGLIADERIVAGNGSVYGALTELR